MKKRILTLLLALVFVFSLASFSVAAEDKTILIGGEEYNVKDPDLLIDAAGLLTGEKQDEILNLLTDISERHQFTVAIITLPSTLEGLSEKELAETLYDQLGFGYGEEHDGCLLLRTLDPKYVYITTMGSGVEIIDPHLDTIFDEMEDYLKGDQYYDAFTTYAQMCDIALGLDSIQEKKPNNDGVFLIDDAGLLTNQEQEKLAKKLKEISEEQEFAIAIVTMETLPEGYTESMMADKLYDDLNYGYGENRDGCLLLRTLNPRYVYVSTMGSGKKIIDPKLESIFDKIEDDMKSDNYYDAFVKFAEQCEKKVIDSQKFPFVKNLLICLAIGLIIALLAVLVMRAQLKSVKPQNLANEYLKDGSLNVTEARDLYLYSHISKTKIERESSGGSSGGGSHGGGGRSM